MGIGRSKSALLVGTALVLVSTAVGVHAQDATATAADGTVLERIVVTGKGKRVAANAVSDTPLATQTTAEELRQKEVNNINDLGKTTEPGVDFANNTPGRSGGLFIRGMGGARIATLIDGIPIPFFQNFARSGFPSPTLNMGDSTGSFDFSSLSSVDVVRGADSSRIGSGALAGALVLNTLEPEDLIPEGRDWGGVAKLTFDGDDRSFGGSVAVARKIQNTSVLLQGGYKKGHERDNEGSADINGALRTDANPVDYDQNNILFKIRQDLEGGHRIGLTAERFDLDHNTELKTLWNEPVGTMSPTRFLPGYMGVDDTRRERVSLDYRYEATSADSLIDAADLTAYWQRLGKGIGSFGSQQTSVGVVSDYARHNAIEENSFGLSGNGISEFTTGNLEHQVRFGGALQFFDTTQFLSGTVASSTGRPDMPDVEGTKVGFYAEDRIALGSSAFALTPGARIDWFNYEPQTTSAFPTGPFGGTMPGDVDGVRLSPKLLATYQANENIELFGQWSMAYRPPTINELYVSFPGGGYNVVGNPGLKAETAQGFEIGGTYSSEDVSGKLTLFHNRYSNYIDVVNVLAPPAPRTITYRNVGDVEISGVELKARKDFANGIFIHGSLNYAYGKNTDTGEVLRTVAPFKSVLGLGYDQETWGAELTTILSAGMRKDGPVADVMTGSNYETFDAPGYGIINITGWWEPEQTKGLRIQAGIYNVLDKTYYNAVGVKDVYTNANFLNSNINQPVAFYSEPGRTFKISLTQKF